MLWGNVHKAFTEFLFFQKRVATPLILPLDLHPRKIMDMTY